MGYGSAHRDQAVPCHECAVPRLAPCVTLEARRRVWGTYESLLHVPIYVCDSAHYDHVLIRPSCQRLPLSNAVRCGAMRSKSGRLLGHATRGARLSTTVIIIASRSVAGGGSGIGEERCRYRCGVPPSIAVLTPMDLKCSVPVTCCPGQCTWLAGPTEQEMYTRYIYRYQGTYPIFGCGIGRYLGLQGTGKVAKRATSTDPSLPCAATVSPGLSLNARSTSRALPPPRALNPPASPSTSPTSISPTSTSTSTYLLDVPLTLRGATNGAMHLTTLENNRGIGLLWCIPDTHFGISKQRVSANSMSASESIAA